MARHHICKVSDIKEGEIYPASAGAVRIVLSRLPDGALKAYTSRCPHQGACLDYGLVTGMVEGGSVNELTVDNARNVLRCPWHGFEFSLETGRAIVQNAIGKYLRLRSYEVEIEGDDVFVVI
ncbi:MAG: Rieske (2Fe-2S) protein [Methyloligellaceae bacterium]